LALPDIKKSSKTLIPKSAEGKGRTTVILVSFSCTPNTPHYKLMVLHFKAVKYLCHIMLEHVFVL